MDSPAICLGTPPEPGCGAILTDEERHYYGSSCEKCERAWADRMAAWREGGADPELDAMYDAPAPTTN